MATRNLTKRFLEVRKAARANRILSEDISDSSELLKQPKGKCNLPPIWVDKMEQLESDLSMIQLKVKDLGILHTTRLRVNFSNNEFVQEAEIETLTQEITDIFHHAESLLKAIGKLGDEKVISNSELKVRSNMQHAMAKKLQGLSIQFRQNQKKYLITLNEQKSGIAAKPETFFTNSKNCVFEDTGFTLSQEQILDDTQEIVSQRDTEITNIARSIEELAQIFKELAVLVIDQGTLLDRIDYNMEQALEHGKTAIHQLEAAEDHQKSAVSVKIIVSLCVAIIITLLIFILKHTKFN